MHTSGHFPRLFSCSVKWLTALTKLGELAELALSQALDKAPALETRNRLKQLLDRLPNIGTSGEPLRQGRAVEVLENIGSPQAK
jgi:hypothetical protein